MFCVPSLAWGRHHGPRGAGGHREGSFTPGTTPTPSHLAYLELPEEFGYLSAVQLLASLLVGANNLVHGHILGCRQRPRQVTLHTLGLTHPFLPLASATPPLSTSFQQPTEFSPAVEAPCCDCYSGDMSPGTPKPSYPILPHLPRAPQTPSHKRHTTNTTPFCYPSATSSTTLGAPSGRTGALLVTPRVPNTTQHRARPRADV